MGSTFVKLVLGSFFAIAAAGPAMAQVTHATLCHPSHADGDDLKYTYEGLENSSATSEAIVYCAGSALSFGTVTLSVWVWDGNPNAQVVCSFSLVNAKGVRPFNHVKATGNDGWTKLEATFPNAAALIPHIRCDLPLAPDPTHRSKLASYIISQ